VQTPSILRANEAAFMTDQNMDRMLTRDSSEADTDARPDGCVAEQLAPVELAFGLDLLPGADHRVDRARVLR
jgi:hypothetical protein